MRKTLLISTIALFATAAAAETGIVTARFEARGLGSQVTYDQIANGFILDIYLEADEPMNAVYLLVDGDPGFQYAEMETFYGITILNYADDIISTPPVNTAGWNASTSEARFLDAGNLPIEFPDNLSTLAVELTAGNGLFAWLEFTAVPPSGNYTIAAAGGSGVNDAQGKVMPVTSIPLQIVLDDGTGDGDTGGDTGGGDTGGGDTGGGDTGGGDTGDGDTGGGDTGDGDTGGDTGDGGTGDGDTGGDTGDGGTGDGDTGGDTGDGGTGDGDTGGDTGDGGTGDGDTGNDNNPPGRIRLLPCGTGAAQAFAMSLVGLYLTSRKRRYN